jgi:hypothetical protein
MFFSRILRAAAHGHEPVVFIWQKYPGDAIASKLVPLAYFVTGLGGITWAGYNVVMKEGGQ